MRSLPFGELSAATVAMAEIIATRSTKLFTHAILL
jgi:hypothetical protein